MMGNVTHPPSSHIVVDLNTNILCEWQLVERAAGNHMDMLGNRDGFRRARAGRQRDLPKYMP